MRALNFWMSQGHKLLKCNLCCHHQVVEGWGRCRRRSKNEWRGGSGWGQKRHMWPLGEARLCFKCYSSWNMVRGKRPLQLYPITHSHTSHLPPSLSLRESKMQGWTSLHSPSEDMQWDGNEPKEGQERTWATVAIFPRKMFPILRLFFFFFQTEKKAFWQYGETESHLSSKGKEVMHEILAGMISRKACPPGLQHTRPGCI